MNSEKITVMEYPPTIETAKHSTDAAPLSDSIAALKASAVSQNEEARDLLSLFRSDVAAWRDIYKPSEKSLFRAGCSLMMYGCGLRTALLHRISHALWRKKIPLLPGMVSRLNLTLHGFDVPANIHIGPGLHIPHPVGTVIYAERIGANITLVSGITIGMRNQPGKFPIIGDNVFVGAGARLLGGITLGDGAVIGANAVVIKDVPAHATAIGVPARILLPEAKQSSSVSSPSSESDRTVSD